MAGDILGLGLSGPKYGDSRSAEHLPDRSPEADGLYVKKATVAVEVEPLAVVLETATGTPQIYCRLVRDHAGSSRKAAIQFLEFLDRHGVTLLRDDPWECEQVPARPVSPPDR